MNNNRQLLKEIIQKFQNPNPKSTHSNTQQRKHPKHNNTGTPNRRRAI
jgi:hypothetical protein